MKEEANYILSLDQGTSSSRALLFDQNRNLISTGQKKFPQIYPQPGWVEHDPEEIWQSMLLAIFQCLSAAEIDVSQVKGIGITNQRETSIIWNLKTGKAIHNAIVWQDRRTADYCNELKPRYTEGIQQKTGLVLDAYFSATKIKYILDKVEGARQQAAAYELAFGTVDTWLLWKLTKGAVHKTDVSNASRTMLYNIHSLAWDEELLTLFDIPQNILPEVADSNAFYGNIDKEWLGFEIPIHAMIGDQQAALFGQDCLEKGEMKNTYGTGCFIMLNTGDECVTSQHNLLSTIAWKRGPEIRYALEGSVFVAGAAIAWLTEGVNLFSDIQEVEQLANSVNDNGGVVFVPALTGLGAPYWDPNARGSFQGLTRGTQKGHIARAALESLALQVDELIDILREEVEDAKIKFLKVDGGATKNDLLMQLQADLSEMEILIPKLQEATAYGAASMAAYALSIWDHGEKNFNGKEEKSFSAKMPQKERSRIKERWKKAVLRCLSWESEESPI